MLINPFSVFNVPSSSFTYFVPFLSPLPSTWCAESLGLWSRIREESVVFEDMLRATVDIANKLEISSQALHAAFTKQLKDIAKIHR